MDEIRIIKVIIYEKIIVRKEVRIFSISLYSLQKSLND